MAGFTKQWLVGILGLSFCGIAWTKDNFLIDYAQAIQLALNNNPRVCATKAEIESAQAGIVETRGSGLPKLGLAMNAARSDNPLNVFGYKLSQGNVSFADFGLGDYTGPASLNTRPTALNNPGYYSNFNAGVKLSIPLYRGGQTVAEVRAARSRLAAAQQGDWAARMQLAYEVLQAYQGVHSAAEMIRLANDALRSARQYAQMTRQLYRQSRVIESDILLADTFVRQSQLAVDEAKVEWQNHLDAFRILIGKPASRIQPGKQVVLPANRLSRKELLQQLIGRNAQLAALQSGVRASRAQVDAAKAHYWPRVNLELRQDWNSNFTGANLASNALVLGFDWTLLSFGERSGAAGKAMADFKQAAYQYDDQVNAIKLRLLQAIRASGLAEIRRRASEANAREVKKAVISLEKRYGRGLTPLGQLLDGQMRWVQAKNQAILSHYQQIMAKGQVLMLSNQLIAAPRRSL